MKKSTNKDSPEVIKAKTSPIPISKISEAGYIAMELSTQGLLGAPKVFHIRNFDSTDILKLALSEDEDLPKKVSEMLDQLIQEDDVSVADFHEKEVIETLVRLYKSFYASSIKNVDFNLEEEDFEFLREKYKNDLTAYQTMINDLRDGNWKPKFDIDLDLIETYDIDAETFKSDVTIVNTRTNFSCAFTWPRYGDVLALKDFINVNFKLRDKQFAKLKEIYQFRKSEENRLRKGENVNLAKIPDLGEDDRKKLIEYETEKAVFSAKALKALHLKNINGIDLTEMNLKERMTYANDPRLDYTLMKKVNEYYANMKVGLIDEITIFNPIKEAVEKRKYTFRLLDLFQAIKLYEADELVIRPE